MSDSRVYLTSAELAARWNTTVNVLAIQRCRLTGPQYFKLGRRVLYKLTDVEDYEAAFFLLHST